MKLNVICERLFPEINERDYQKILFLTSPKLQANAYTKFFCREYLKDNIPLEYVYKTGDYKQEDLQDLTNRHFKLRQAGVVKDVSEYKSFNDMIEDLNSSQYKTKSEKSNEASKGAELIAQIGSWNVYNIKTYDACRKYGYGTTWCITDWSKPDTFNSYIQKNRNYKSYIWYIIETKSDYKYAAEINWKVYDKPSWLSTEVNFFNPEDKCVFSYNLLSENGGNTWNDGSNDVEKQPKIIQDVLKLIIDKYGIDEQGLLDKLKDMRLNESALEGDRTTNRLLKNYVIRANKQLKDGIKLTDALRDEIVDYYKNQNKDLSDYFKMDIIYRCPKHIADKYIDIFKDKVKYNPKN